MPKNPVVNSTPTKPQKRREKKSVPRLEVFRRLLDRLDANPERFEARVMRDPLAAARVLAEAFARKPDEWDCHKRQVADDALWNKRQDATALAALSLADEIFRRYCGRYFYERIIPLWSLATIRDNQMDFKKADRAYTEALRVYRQNQRTSSKGFVVNGLQYGFLCQAYADFLASQKRFEESSDWHGEAVQWWGLMDKHLSEHDRAAAKHRNVLLQWREHEEQRERLQKQPAKNLRASVPL
jgi:hypothetical protein